MEDRKIFVPTIGQFRAIKDLTMVQMWEAWEYETAQREKVHAEFRSLNQDPKDTSFDGLRVPYESRGAAPDKVDDRGLNFDNLRDPPEPSGGHKTYLNKTYLNEALEKRQVEINKRMRDFNDAKVTPVLTIKHFKGVEQTIVPDLFHEAYAELRHENWVSPSINIHWEDEALVAYYADFPVGMITFVEQKFDKSIFIKMAYVRHNYRTQGVYRELYAKLREMAKERKVMLIIGVTDINNKPAQKAMEGVGRKAQYITYIDKLEDAL